MDDSTRKTASRQLDKARDELSALREEARLKLHLAGMDARDAWTRLEPSIEDAERDVERAAEGALQKVEAAGKKLREFLASIR